MLKVGFRVEGRTKFTQGKQGTIIREIGQGRKRKLEVQWDNQSIELHSVKALRQIMVPPTLNQEITGTEKEIRSPNLDALDGMDHAEEDDDTFFDVDRDRFSENEVEPEAYLEAPLLT